VRYRDRFFLCRIKRLPCCQTPGSVSTILELFYQKHNQRSRGWISLFPPPPPPPPPQTMIQTFVEGLFAALPCGHKALLPVLPYVVYTIPALHKRTLLCSLCSCSGWNCDQLLKHKLKHKHTLLCSLVLFRYFML
jgi:hypothetical protein